MSTRTKVAKYVCEKVASHIAPIRVRWMVRHLTNRYGISAAEANLTITSLVDRGALQLDSHPFRGHVLSPPQEEPALELAKKSFFVPDSEWDDATLDSLIQDWSNSDEELGVLLCTMFRFGSTKKRIDVLCAILDYELKIHAEGFEELLISVLESTSSSILTCMSAFALVDALPHSGGIAYLQEVVAKGGPDADLIESALNRSNIP